MTDFKTTKKAMYTTPMDVRLILEVFKRQMESVEEDVAAQKIDDSMIESHIYDADAIIVGYLGPVYGEGALVAETPYFKPPIPVDGVSSRVRLRGVVVAAAAITEQWLIEFLGPDAFELIGSFSGSQGEGSIASDFTSNNLDIQIMAVDWHTPEDEQLLAGTVFMFGTYISHPLVRTISSQLASASLIDYLYAEAESSQSSWGKALYKKAMDLLKQLADEDSSVSLSGTVPAALEHGTTGYDIDAFGRDGTAYADIAYDKLPFGNNTGEDDAW